MISIVIPLYNKETQILKTLESVFAQTYSDYEIVIVNDGSTDKSVEVVESIKDPRIRLIHQKNAGVSAARNRGIEEARGEYIALLDADDLWKPEYLETIVGLIDKYPECEVFAMNYEFLDNKGIIKPTIIRKLPFKSVDGILTNYFEVASVSSPPLWTSAVVVSKKAYKTVYGFPVGIKSGEDLLTWARLACKYKIAYCSKPLAVFVFDETIFNEDQKKRAVSRNDEVGKGLIELYRSSKDHFLRQYIGLWYKMRTRICLSKGDRSYAIKNALKSLSFDVNIKIIVFLIMCALPHKVNYSLFKKFG